MKKLALVLVFALFLSGCAVKDFQRFDKNAQKSAEVKEIPEGVYQQEKVFEWKIQQGDRVEITAFNQSSNSGGQLSELLNSGGQRVYTQRVGDEGMLIGADGMVNLPLIGNIKIVGMTEKQASEKLIEGYKTYLRSPYVAVKILNQRLFVLGEVNKPGVVLVTNGTMSLFEALASSGDITDFADRKSIRVIRGDMRHPEVRSIDMTDFASITASSLILRPNDVVYVASREERASMVGFDEELPWARFIATILQPFSTAAVVYGVTK